MILNKIKIGTSSYSQTNCGWWQSFDGFSGKTIWIPNSVKMIGLLVNNDIRKEVYFAPAGLNNGKVINASKTAFNPDQEIQEALYTRNLNYQISWPWGEMSIEGQKTNLDENSAFNRINTRRQFLFLERYAMKVCQRFVYEPNNTFTRDSLLAELKPEFDRQLAAGGLYDYKIVCDESNNTFESIDRNELHVAILLQPVRASEYVICNFVASRSGSDLNEVYNSTILAP